MNIEIRFGENAAHRVHINFSDVQLYPGAGVNRLQLTARISQTTAPTGSSLMIQGQASFRHSQAPSLWLGNWAAAAPNYVRAFPDSGEAVNLPLTDEQIWRIEDLRKGDFFTLDLRISAMLIVDGLVYPSIGETTYQFTVDRDVWLRHLMQIELVSAFTLATTTPAIGDVGQTTLGRLLREARQKHEANDPKDAVVAVRRTLDALKGMIQALPSEKSIIDTPREQRTELQRWALLFHAAAGVANTSPHGDPNALSVEYDRRDSQAMIATALGLVARDWD